MSTIEYLTRPGTPSVVDGVDAVDRGGQAQQQRTELLVAIDVETGGFDPGVHALLSVAVHAGDMANGFTGQKLEHAQCLWPEKEYVVEASAAEVNGYTVEAWEKQGAVNEAVALVRLIEVLTNWLRTEGAERCVMVAHGVAFDQGFLYAALRRHQLEEAWERIVRKRWRCSCATLSAMMDAGLLPEGKAGLDDLNALRPLPRRTGTHDAGEDARLCFDGYVWLIGCLRGRQWNDDRCYVCGSYEGVELVGESVVFPLCKPHAADVEKVFKEWVALREELSPNVPGEVPA